MTCFFLPKPELSHLTVSSGFFFTRTRGGKVRIVSTHGMNVLTLFSVTGGAEVALHRLGIRMNNVISIEKSEVKRNILNS
ncbi:hypothetical protein SETIT_3G329700v2 [Setaria italica]|uniref:Uncharacterized protein n=1 Tax=Setaria italica TaxID=4555 RepID=A0A368QLB0_SETIT|nr:hypothetical protein SETIT_3G329700v2 [Setaria italica]